MNKIYRKILKNLAIFAIIIMTIMPGIAFKENVNPTPTPSNTSNNISPAYNINNETVNGLNKEINNSLNKEINNSLNRESNQITVPANPLWTYAGLYVNTGDTIYITANGWWTIDNYHWFGPDGFSAYSTDIFYKYANYGELIAFIGPDPYQGNWGNGNFFPQYTGYWTIGSNGQFVSDKSGILWLGFNDDAVSKNTYDNAGSVSAYITIRSPTVTVTSPNGGENWQRGNTKTIIWTSTGIGPRVEIELWKGGVFDRLLAHTALNNGNWNWAIPSIIEPRNDYRIRIWACTGTPVACDYPYSYVSDMSDNNFIIGGTSSITVVSPNGYENWARGNTKTITWSSSGSPGADVKIELLKGGVLNSVISSSTSNDGSYSWFIPAFQPIGSDYKVRITSTSNSLYRDMSNNNFIISSSTPSITVVSPNGGENWRRGTTRTISWSYGGNVGTNVKIELLKGGVLNSVISSSTSNDGSYSWFIPTFQPTGNDYKIRITSTSNSLYKDNSNNNFIVSN